MRFIPASRYLDMPGEATAKNLLKNQISFNQNHVRFELPTTAIYKKYPDHGNKTLMEMILDLKCDHQNNEPYFRHIIRKWTKDPTQLVYQVSVHKQMSPYSQQALLQLRAKLKHQYGDDVADDIDHTDEVKQEVRTVKSASNTTLSIDTNDRYANGPAKFIIEGMEALNTNDSGPTLQERKQQEGDNYTMGMQSEGTNLSQETSRTNDAQPKEVHQTQGPREPESDGWRRVGSEDDETKLREQLSPNKAAPDPGRDQGQQP